ncbi:MAG: hypothetical protein MK097_21305, partial [Dechloromonas sp.]|nr:hypothetical protein [Dechloromonas sp.]
ALSTLNIAGLLIKTGRGTVATGPTSLDSLADAHHTDVLREDRITRYRAERDQWHAWLEDRYNVHDQARMDAIMLAMPVEPSNVKSTLWDIALANGPPDELVADDNAIELVLTMLGGRILTPG